MFNRFAKLNEVTKFSRFSVMKIESRDGIVYDVLLDNEDVESALLECHWCPKKDKSGNVYVSGFDSKALHRFVMKANEGQIVDHINHDTLDNRKCNLRFTTYAENAFNRAGATIRSQTGVRGVQPCRDKFRVLIAKKHYGYFDTLDEAKSVADTIYRERLVLN